MGMFDFLKEVTEPLQDVMGIAAPFMDFFGGRSQQSSSQSFAREQMAFQERMSNTAHQREVQDLRAAGLNPILSAKFGGSSSPTGSMGTAVNILGQAARTGVASARALRMTDAQTEALEEGADLSREEQDLRKYQKSNLYEDTLRKAEEVKNLRALRDNIMTEGRILGHEEHSAKARATADTQREDALEGSPWARRIGSIVRELLPLGSAANSARSLTR